MSSPQRFVLFHPGGAPTPDELKRLVDCPLLDIVDDVRGRALLANATPETIAKVRGDFPGWTISEEQVHAAPRPVTPPALRPKSQPPKA